MLKTSPMMTAMMFSEYSAHGSRIHTTPPDLLSSGSGSQEMISTNATA
jgi:hypothetical protein